MKKIGIAVAVLLLILAISSGGTNHTKLDYLQLVENKADITSGYTWYRMCNPTSVSYSISDSSKLNVTFIEVKNRLTNNRYTKLTNVSFSITKYDNFCTNYNITYPSANASPEWTETVTNCVLKANGTTTGYHLEWLEWNPIGEIIPANTCYDIKVEGTYQAVLDGTAIDNIISFAGFSYDEYAWWNTTWNTRCQINLTAPGDILHQNDENNPWDYIEIRPTAECNFNSTGDLKDVRIVKNNTEGTMTALVRDNYKNQSIIFMLNSSINGTTDINYYVYYNATGIEEPSQTDYVMLSGAGNISVRNRIYNISNCAITKCINANGDNANRCGNYGIGALSVDGDNTFVCGGIGLDGNTKQCSIRYDGSLYAEIYCENGGTNKPGNLFRIYANGFINLTTSVGTSSSISVIRDAFSNDATNGYDDNKWFDGKVDRNMQTDPNTDFSSDAYGNGTGITFNYGSPAWGQDLGLREWYVNQSITYTTSVRSSYNGNGLFQINPSATNGGSYNFSRWIGFTTNKSNDPYWYYRGDYIAKGLRNPVTYKLGTSEASSGVTPSPYVSEGSGDNAIELGINQSVIGTQASIYNDKRVYIRTSNNTQSLGKFDKVATSGNQVWAINYVTEDDPTSNFTYMTNITLIFYVHEITNITTTANIIEQVKAFINTTKR